MKKKQTSPKEIIYQEYQRRLHRNPKYSLRAYSKFLGVSHSSLSFFLSGKRSLGVKAATKIAKVLELSETESLNFVDFFKLDKRKVESIKQNQLAKAQVEHQLEQDEINHDLFSAMAHWHLFAILSLLDIPGETFSASNISKRLNIGLESAQDAMDILKRLEMVKEINGKWVQSQASIRLNNKQSLEAGRQLQKELLLKALHSLEHDQWELRHHSSVTLILDPVDMDYAKDKIREFRLSLMNELEARGRPKKKKVYNLTVQLCPASD